MNYAQLRIYETSTGFYNTGRVRIPGETLFDSVTNIKWFASGFNQAKEYSGFKLTVDTVTTTSDGSSLELAMFVQNAIESLAKHKQRNSSSGPKPGELLPVKPGTMDVDWDSYEKAKRPKIVEYNCKEGGRWYPMENPHQDPCITVHALKFSDGWIWDTMNGWRDKK